MGCDACIRGKTLILLTIGRASYGFFLRFLQSLFANQICFIFLILRDVNIGGLLWLNSYENESMKMKILISMHHNKTHPCLMKPVYKEDTLGSEWCKIFHSLCIGTLNLMPCVCKYVVQHPFSLLHITVSNKCKESRLSTFFNFIL